MLLVIMTVNNKTYNRYLGLGQKITKPLSIIALQLGYKNHNNDRDEKGVTTTDIHTGGKTP
jgi:hypothetical protein